MKPPSKRKPLFGRPKRPAGPPGNDPHNELLNREFDQGNDDLDAIKSSLGVADKRRPASE